MHKIPKENLSLIYAYGWVEIARTKFPWMKSFKNERTSERLNYYFTTGTVTIDKSNGRCKVIRNITTEDLETLLIENK